MKGSVDTAIAWCLTLLGLKRRVQSTLSEMVEVDLAVAGAVARAHALSDVEAYACELDRRGEAALAAEVRRQVALLVPAPAVAVAPPPAVLPSPPPPAALPPAVPPKRKPGRPPKSPPALPPGPG